MRVLWLPVAAFLLNLLAGPIASTAQAQDAGPRGAAAGHRLAARICAECHVVSSGQQTHSTLTGYGPSFVTIANRPDTTLQTLQAFLAHPHALSRMPYPDLTQEQRAAVAAYIVSLRGQH